MPGLEIPFQYASVFEKSTLFAHSLLERLLSISPHRQGVSRPAIILKVVVLPHPREPNKARSCPLSAQKEMPLTTSLLLKLLD